MSLITEGVVFAIVQRCSPNLNSVQSEKVQTTEADVKALFSKQFHGPDWQRDADMTGSDCAENAGVLIRGFLRERDRRSPGYRP